MDKEREDRTVLAQRIASQDAEHRPYGGVVPEIAARAHAETLAPMVGAVLEEAGLTLSDMDAIAATAGPGLIGGVMVGLVTAKARAFLDTALGSNLWGHNPGGDCDLPPFTYILLPNDHTQGGAQGRPTPISHYQDNDEATGLLIDAISHSTAWPETLVVVIEDDPAQGGDHVDNHRSLALLASPWVRRGGVSHVLYNTSALHRTIELILGVPPHNAVVAAGAPMYDAFTGTPDYTPFDYQPRLECATTNGGGMWADLTAGMDLSQPDNAPGLDRLVWRMLHAGHEPPWAPAADEDGDGD